MSLDSIIDLDITIKDTAVSRAGFGTPLIMATVVPFQNEVRSYSSAAALAADGFASTSEPYLAAQAIFSQSPSPSLVKIGMAGERTDAIADALDAITSIDDDWYALVLSFHQHSTEQLLDVAAWIEARRKLLLATSAEAKIMDDSKDDLASRLRELGYHRTALIYHPEPQTYPAAAWGGVMLPKDPGSASWKFKSLSGIVPITLTDTQRSHLDSKHCNHYTRVAGVSIMREGYASSGRYLDITRGIDWLHARMQEELFSVFANAEKIPFTDGGISILENTIRGVLGAGVDSELLDPDGIEVHVPRVAELSAVDRPARVLPNVSFAARLAGAIHKVRIAGTVSV